MEKKPIFQFEVLNEGGAWLGALRSRIQSKFINGDSVTWGSNELLRPQVTVRDLEELAAAAVAADRNDAENRAKRAANEERMKKMLWDITAPQK